MTGNAKTGQSVAGRSHEDLAAGDGSGMSVPRPDDFAQQMRAEVNRERARWHITLGSIRAQLEEQPSRSAARAAARRWCAAITALAEEVPQ